MELVEFGKVMKVKYGSLPSEIFMVLFNLYTEDKNIFEKHFGVLDGPTDKGFFIFKDENSPECNYIIFGEKYTAYDKDKNAKTFKIKGKVVARNSNATVSLDQTIDGGYTNRFTKLNKDGLSEA